LTGRFNYSVGTLAALLNADALAPCPQDRDGQTPRCARTFSPEFLKYTPTVKDGSARAESWFSFQRLRSRRRSLTVRERRWKRLICRCLPPRSMGDEAARRPQIRDVRLTCRNRTNRRTRYPAAHPQVTRPLLVKRSAVGIGERPPGEHRWVSSPAYPPSTNPRFTHGLLALTASKSANASRS
jgi:hypothetical protein